MYELLDGLVQKLLTTWGIFPGLQILTQKGKLMTLVKENSFKKEHNHTKTLYLYSQHQILYTFLSGHRLLGVVSADSNFLSPLFSFIVLSILPFVYFFILTLGESPGFSVFTYTVCHGSTCLSFWLFCVWAFEDRSKMLNGIFFSSWFAVFVQCPQASCLCIFTLQYIPFTGNVRGSLIVELSVYSHNNNKKKSLKCDIF